LKRCQVLKLSQLKGDAKYCPKEKPCPEDYNEPKKPAEYYKPNEPYLGMSSEYMGGFLIRHEGYKPFLYNDKTEAKKQVENPQTLEEIKAQKGNCSVGIGHLVHYGKCHSNSDYQKYTAPEYASTPEGEKAQKEKQFREQRALKASSDQELEYYKKIAVSDLEVAIKGVERNLKNVPLTRSQYEAMVDLAFNAGVGGMMNNQVYRELKKQKYEKAATEMRTARLGKKPSPGTIKRRNAKSYLMNNDCIGYDK
jgi:GH24 family phage-related lysozyme (muramidase)